MMFQGMPWPLLLPLAALAMLIGSMNAATAKRKTKKKKR